MPVRATRWLPILAVLLGLAAHAPARHAAFQFDDFPAVVENMAGVVESAGDALVAAGAIERADLEQRLERLRAFGRRDDAALWYALCWAEGVRPEGS